MGFKPLMVYYFQKGYGTLNWKLKKISDKELNEITFDKTKTKTKKKKKKKKKKNKKKKKKNDNNIRKFLIFFTIRAIWI